MKNWAQYDPANQEGIISLNALVTMFSNNYFKRRMDTDYVSNMRTYMGEMVGSLQKLENAGSFFKFQ
ncbi:MAG: hypothetical protein GY866_38820 [Proteobacteria bacterium]|nr:hypothetical protein [Pseudomonadota bacterium]